MKRLHYCSMRLCVFLAWLTVNFAGPFVSTRHWREGHQEISRRPRVYTTLPLFGFTRALFWGGDESKISKLSFCFRFKDKKCICRLLHVSRINHGCFGMHTCIQTALNAHFNTFTSNHSQEELYLFQCGGIVCPLCES